jgi:hypothetical protein
MKVLKQNDKYFATKKSESGGCVVSKLHPYEAIQNPIEE